MNNEYLKILFKKIGWEATLDYAFMCAKIKIENEVNKLIIEYK
jgi:hypothetical protein